MIKSIGVCIALIVLGTVYVSAETPTTQNPLIGTVCPGGIKDGYHADAKDPNKYYRCLRGKIISASHCEPGLVWDETKNACARPLINVHCPEPNGTFPMPGNAHKFIVCSENHGFIVTCPTDLIFNVTTKACDFNDGGVTWPSDPTTVVTNPVVTGTQTHATEGPTQTTVTHATTCDYKGNKPDPNDKHSYFNCHLGKLLHQTCPDGEIYNDENKDCE